jgi:hypothetical protein
MRTRLAIAFCLALVAAATAVAFTDFNPYCALCSIYNENDSEWWLLLCAFCKLNSTLRLL